MPSADVGSQHGTMSDVTGPEAPLEADRPADDAGGEQPAPRGRRLSVPLVPVLAAVLVLLLAAVAFLWFTRPEPSSLRTDTYAEALQAARSNVVDMTSYDHLTFDDDLEQIRRVTTGEMQEQSIAELDAQRDAIVDNQVVVNTEVLDAGITRATEDEATVLLLIEATQSTEGSDQLQVRQYPIEVDLQRQDNGRWLLSGIRGR